MNAPVRLLNLQDCADLLGVDESTVRRQIRAGALVSSPIGRRILVHPADLVAYQQALRCPSQSAPMVPISSPFVTLASDIERLIGTGRTKKRGRTNVRSSRKSAHLHAVPNQNTRSPTVSRAG